MELWKLLRPKLAYCAIQCGRSISYFCLIISAPRPSESHDNKKKETGGSLSANDLLGYKVAEDRGKAGSLTSPAS